MRGQLGPLGGQGLALVIEAPAAGLELGGPAGMAGSVPQLIMVGVVAGR